MERVIKENPWWFWVFDFLSHDNSMYEIEIFVMIFLIQN